ncbi:hypothetical protein [Hazenella coriacea]|uniref:Uncharacterized protein n=1 Tax=Hazenella coriacea TaxID=1179467 RepID=A0A4R3L085_9BACL|nr:hypothetical protein [Hazenella coriacea]TCS92218.1 hypothetical protein EDD58_1149 [Hazenella coriacea]
MSKKRTYNEKITIRITPAVAESARRIAKQDYDDASRISPVWEDAMTKYISFRQTGDDLTQLMAATEGELFKRVNHKFETEFDKLIERVGDLLAKHSFYTIYGSLVTEEQLKYMDLPNKQMVKQIRDNKWKKAHEILQLHYATAGSPQTIGLLEENQQLLKQIEELKQQQQQANNKNRSLLEEIQQQKEQKESYTKQIQRYKRLIKHIASSEKKTIVGTYTLSKPVQDLVNEFLENERG